MGARPLESAELWLSVEDGIDYDAPEYFVILDVECREICRVRKTGVVDMWGVLSADGYELATDVKDAIQAWVINDGRQRCNTGMGD